MAPRIGTAKWHHELPPPSSEEGTGATNWALPNGTTNW